MTPLMYAVSNDHGGATGLLCDYGADVGVWCTDADLPKCWNRCATSFIFMDRSVAEASESDKSLVLVSGTRDTTTLYVSR